MARSERVLTYEDVRRTPEDGKRYELLEGQLVVTASPNTRHQGIVVRLLSMLLWPAEQHGYGCAFGAPVDVVLHETEAVVVPDLVFIAKDRLGIRWYWVIDPERQVIRVFEWRDGAYTEQAPRRPGDTLTSPLFPDVSAALTEVLEGVIP
jgi:Uma2 family endonuclease